jgi:hypothetical protein
VNYRFVLRRILLLLCLLGTQHAALAHAYEHFLLPDTASVSEHGGNEGGDALVCPDCLTAHSIEVISMIAATLLPQDVFGHVVSAQADGLGSALMLLDLHAQGPPVLPLI